MLGLIDTAKAYWVGWKFKHSTLGQALALETQRYFYSDQVLSALSQETKDRIIGDFYRSVVAVSRSADPRMELRSRLTEYVLAFAELSAICLTEGEKAVMEYGLNPYISGELHHRISDLVSHCNDLQRYVENEGPQTEEDLISYGNSRGAMFLYYANGFNMVRIYLGDHVPENDWYRPFVEASIAWSEDNLREKLEMPRLPPPNLYGLPYSTFFNLVLSGKSDPFVEWTNSFPNLYLAGKGRVQSAS